MSAFDVHAVWRQLLRTMHVSDGPISSQSWASGERLSLKCPAGKWLASLDI